MLENDTIQNWMRSMFLRNFFLVINSDIARELWVRLQLQDIPRDQTLLDVGAGELKYKKYCGHLKYQSQDFGQYKGVGDRVGLQTKVWNTSGVDIVSDITKIPVASQSFKNVLCSEVLEHIPYPELAIKEISRILKKGGKLILTAPFCAQVHMSPYFYYSGFSTNWYKTVFEKYNLKILNMKANGNFFRYINQELARFPLTVKKYSDLGFWSIGLYAFIIPVIIIIYLVSRITKGSEQQLCFGWYIVAKKC